MHTTVYVMRNPLVTISMDFIAQITSRKLLLSFSIIIIIININDNNNHDTITTIIPTAIIHYYYV